MLHTVTLRPVTLADATQRYADWLNDPEVSRFMETRWSVHTPGSITDYILSLRNSWLFAIIADNIHIGNIKLGNFSHHHQRADVSLLIGDKAYWGRGGATHAIKEVVEIAKARGLRKLEAGIYAPNLGSLAAFLKAGFKIEGWRDSAAAFEGGRCDVIMVGMVL